MELYSGHEDIILSVDIITAKSKQQNEDSDCPKTSLAVTGAKDNDVRLWQIDLGNKFQKRIICLAVFKGHSSNVSSVYFAPKSAAWFASVAQDNTLKIWTIPEDNEENQGECQVINSAKLTIMAHLKSINCVRISPNDKIVATAS